MDYFFHITSNYWVKLWVSLGLGRTRVKIRMRENTSEKNKNLVVAVGQAYAVRPRRSTENGRHSVQVDHYVSHPAQFHLLFGDFLAVAR